MVSEFVFLPEAAAKLQQELEDDTARGDAARLLFGIEALIGGAIELHHGVSSPFPWQFRSAAALVEFFAIVDPIIDMLLAGEDDERTLAPHILFLDDLLRFMRAKGIRWARRIDHVAEAMSMEPVRWPVATMTATATATLVLAAARVHAGKVTADPAAAPALVLVAPHAPPGCPVPTGSERAT